jgi:hypothetical protein
MIVKFGAGAQFADFFILQTATPQVRAQFSADLHREWNRPKESASRQVLAVFHPFRSEIAGVATGGCDDRSGLRSKNGAL